MGPLDYFSAVFGEMLTYHAVGEFFLGGGQSAAGFPLNVTRNLLA